MVAGLPSVPPRSRRLVAAQAAVLALVLLAGLLRVATSEDPGVVLRRAAGALRSVGTVRAVVTISRDHGRWTGDETGIGQLDLARRQAALTYVVPLGLRGQGPADVVVVSDGPRAWVRVPDDRAVFYAGRHWLGYGTDATWHEPDENDDPLAIVDGLAAATGVRRVGRERLGTVATTRYRARVPVSGRSVRADVWVGRDGLPRRVTFAVAAERLAYTVRLDLSDFGVPVFIRVPPGRDTIPVASAGLARQHLLIGIVARG